MRSDRDFSGSTQRQAPPSRRAPRGAIAAAALLAGVVGGMLTLIGAAAATNSSECDGPCFGEWPMTYLPLAVGMVCALVTGWILWERLTRPPDAD
jgi:hypothetical protein